MAAAHQRRDAARMLQFMVACQGEKKSWEKQRDALVKLLR